MWCDYLESMSEAELKAFRLSLWKHAGDASKKIRCPKCNKRVGVRSVFDSKLGETVINLSPHKVRTTKAKTPKNKDKRIRQR